MYWSLLFPSLRAAEVSENVRTPTRSQALHHWCGQEVRGGPEGTYLSLLPKLLPKAISNTISLVHVRIRCFYVLCWRVATLFSWLAFLILLLFKWICLLQIIFLVDLGHNLLLLLLFQNIRLLRTELQKLGESLQSAERACCHSTGAGKLRQALTACDDILIKQVRTT